MREVAAGQGSPRGARSTAVYRCSLYGTRWYGRHYVLALPWVRHVLGIRVALVQDRWRMWYGWREGNVYR